MSMRASGLWGISGPWGTQVCGEASSCWQMLK